MLGLATKTWTIDCRNYLLTPNIPKDLGKLQKNISAICIFMEIIGFILSWERS